MKTKRIWTGFTVLILAALACQVGSAPIISSQPGVSQSSAPAQQPPLQVQAPNNPSAQQDAFVALYQQSIPGIVTIVVNLSQGSALGSGFVYDTQGHIVTNDHVVQGALNNKVEVDFNSGLKVYGTVIGTDPDSDLAIIKVGVPASELHPIPVGDSGALKVGQTVVAIGNPFGESGTMTVGIVSGLSRNWTLTMSQLLQSRSRLSTVATPASFALTPSSARSRRTRALASSRCAAKRDGSQI